MLGLGTLTIDLADVLQLLTMAGAAIAVYTKMRSDAVVAAEANAAQAAQISKLYNQIDGMKSQMTSQHSELETKIDNRLSALNSRIDTLFAHDAKMGRDVAKLEAIGPRVERAEVHIDRLSERVSSLMVGGGVNGRPGKN